jgi:hypothetical protein
MFVGSWVWFRIGCLSGFGRVEVASSNFLVSLHVFKEAKRLSLFCDRTALVSLMFLASKDHSCSRIRVELPLPGTKTDLK